MKYPGKKRLIAAKRSANQDPEVAGDPKKAAGSARTKSNDDTTKKKTVDKVIVFDSSEGDAIVIADEVVSDLTEDPTLAVADTKEDLKQLSKDCYDLLYFEPKGDLYVDGNGDSKGFGKKSEGGMIADLPNDSVLTESDVLIGV